MGEGRDRRGWRRGQKTDLDKDRDRTGNDGSHKEKKVESHREPEKERGKFWGKMLGDGRRMGRNRETVQCSKHLLSTYWVLKSRVQGGHSESLRSDWLTGKRRKKETVGFSMIPILDHTAVSPLDTLQHKRLRSECRRDFFKGWGRWWRREFPRVKMGKSVWLSTHQPGE